MCKRLRLLLTAGVLLTVLPAFQAHTTPFPDKRARKITLYYLPLHSFIRYHIDSLRVRNGVKLRVRRPDQFLTRLRTALGPAQPAESANYQHLRILYAVTYTDGSQQKILADAGGNVLWNGRMYRGSKTLDHVLLSAIGPNDREKVKLPPDLKGPGK